MEEKDVIDKRKPVKKKAKTVEIWKVRAFFIVILIVAVIGFVIIPFALDAKSIGTGIGGRVGEAVGTAIGSFKGVSEGLQEGHDAGLNTEDTEVAIQEEVRAVKNLEVMSAKVKILDNQKVGEKYQAEYVIKANVVFSVDLTSVSVYKNSEGKYVMQLDKPAGELHIDVENSEKIAETMKKRDNGSTADGVTAYINSLNNIKEATEENVDDYDSLVEQAEKIAEAQIPDYISQIEGKPVSVDFDWR